MLSRSAAFFLLGGRAVIFDQNAQQLLEVDEISAFLACSLSEPLGVEDLVQGLVARGLGPALSQERSLHFLETWSQLGRIDCVGANVAEAFTQTLGLAGVTVSVAYHDRHAHELVSPVFRLLEAGAGAPLVHYRLFGWGERVLIQKPGEKTVVVAPDQVAPTLKALVTADMLDHLGDGLALHAALVAGASRTMLICGPPGAGKSTLATSLAMRGLAYGGDDIAILTGNDALAGIPFAPTLKRGSWSLIAAATDQIARCPVHRRLDGKDIRYLPYGGKVAGPSTSDPIVILLRRQAEGPVIFKPVDPVKCLDGLVAGAFTPQKSLSTTQFARLARLASNARCVELEYSDLDEATLGIMQAHAH